MLIFHVSLLRLLMPAVSAVELSYAYAADYYTSACCLHTCYAAFDDAAIISRLRHYYAMLMFFRYCYMSRLRSHHNIRHTAITTLMLLIDISAPCPP